MSKSESEKLVDAIVNNDNVNALKTLEDILKGKCAEKISKVLNK